MWPLPFPDLFLSIFEGDGRGCTHNALGPESADPDTVSVPNSTILSFFTSETEQKRNFFLTGGVAHLMSHASSPRYAVLRVATSLLIYKQLAPLTFLNKVSENYYTLQEAVKSTYRQDLRYIAGHYFH